MFLRQLEPKQQKAFLSLAAQLASMGGTHGSEEDLLRSLRAETGLNHDLIGQEVDVEETVSLFVTKSAKAAVCLELLGIVYADGECGTDEGAYVESVADLMRVGTAELLGMENWVLRQVMLSREAQQFFQE